MKDQKLSPLPPLAPPTPFLLSASSLHSHPILSIPSFLLSHLLLFFLLLFLQVESLTFFFFFLPLPSLLNPNATLLLLSLSLLPFITSFSSHILFPSSFSFFSSSCFFSSWLCLLPSPLSPLPIPSHPIPWLCCTRVSPSFLFFFSFHEEHDVSFVLCFCAWILQLDLTAIMTPTGWHVVSHNTSSICWKFSLLRLDFTWWPPLRSNRRCCEIVWRILPASR